MAKNNSDGLRGSDAMGRLIEAFKVVPNVGEKTAQRIVFHLLQERREGAVELRDALDEALRQVRRCRMCNTLCEGELCALCSDPERDRTSLLVVGMPTDIVSVESARCYNGLYYVLGGDLSPLEGGAPDKEVLIGLVNRIVEEGVREIIIGTGFTSSGETSAYVLGVVLAPLGVPMSRLARGIPLGGELEYTDHGTIAQSFYNRRDFTGL